MPARAMYFGMGPSFVMPEKSKESPAIEPKSSEGRSISTSPRMNRYQEKTSENHPTKS